jgi:hypothetical protein
MRPHDLDLLSWSLFAMTSEDIAALSTLSSSSILCTPDQRTLNLSQLEIQGGRRIALSLRAADSDVYKGLCVFGLESPSPASDKAIALHVLSLDQFPEPKGKATPTRDTIGLTLLTEVRRFCVTHGYTRIHCFAPADSDTLALLVRHGFEPEGVALGGYEKTFSLTLHLASAYTGDPYDGRHLLHWIAEQLRLEVISSSDITCESLLGLASLNLDLADTALAESKLPIYLELDANPDGRDYLRIGVKTRDSYVQAASLSLDQLRDLSGEKRIDMTLWPPPEQGASIAVEIRPDLFNRFRTGAKNAFFDSGSYGTLLEYGIAHGVAPTIFFVDFATTTTNPRLIGIGTVREVHRGSPDELWRQWGEISSWSDKEEFGRYRAIKRKMTVIVFDSLREVNILGAGLPLIGHSWTYVEADQAYEVSRHRV